MIKPKGLDLAICEWTKDTGYSLTEKQQVTLVASIFNALFSDGNIHTMPNDNEHLESKDCWCNPLVNYLDPESGTIQYVHTDTRKEALQ